MTPGPQRRAVSLALAAVALGTCGVTLAQGVAPAPVPRPPYTTPTATPAPVQAPVPRPPYATTAPRPEAGVRWQTLSPLQRQALAPLEREWAGIDASRKQKWLAIADRYPTLPAPERTRIAERMTEWARLSPVERGELRLRYQEARQVPAPARSARWEEYQNLPADQKEQFAARAAASAAVRGRAKAPAAGKGSLPPRDANQAKANVVPNPALAQPPRLVAPTVVQAATGATTRLITRPVTPPAHQQSGMPKIAATPEFVNRSTLLPRRGPQAAAVAPAPSTQPVPLSTQPAPAPAPRAALPAPAPRATLPVPARPGEPTPPQSQ
ncbi:MAG: DUF3106 domain-containing protein [Caldimonas sp.]